MKFSNILNSLLTNLIPPKIHCWPKFLAWNSRSKSHISLTTCWIPTSKGSKFKLFCVELRNKYILMMDVISFKLRLINFVYLLRHPAHDAFIRSLNENDSSFIMHSQFIHSAPEQNRLSYLQFAYIPNK